MVLVISKAPILPAYSEPPSTPDPTAASGPGNCNFKSLDFGFWEQGLGDLVLGLGLGFGLGGFEV